jgi:hypothetical protein
VLVQYELDAVHVQSDSIQVGQYLVFFYL